MTRVRLYDDEPVSKAAAHRDRVVYVIFDLKGRPRYIGKGSGSRPFAHARQTHNLRLQQLYRRTADELPICVIREGLTDAEAFEIEIALIAAVGRCDLGEGPLYNLAEGGGCSFGNSPLTRAKKSASHTGVKRPEVGLLISATMRARGITFPRSATELSAERKRGKRIPWLHDKPRTAAHAAKQSAALRGRVWWTTPEGCSYQSIEPRSTLDGPGRLCTWTKLSWWSTPGGISYKASAPRSEVDVRGRAALTGDQNPMRRSASVRGEE